MTEKHTILGGKVHVYKRPESPIWQCSTYLAGKNRRVSTKESSLRLAKEFAEDWYLGLRGKNARGDIRDERTFKDAADQFTREYEVITEGERSEKWVEGHQARLRLHLLPYFGSCYLSDITAGKVQDYRLHRMQAEDGRRAPSRSTLHDELVTLRQVLKTALRHEWLAGLPDLSTPYRASAKVSHRAWFSLDEYKALYTATRANAKAAAGRVWEQAALDLHDKVLFLANTGIRPDEAKWLQFRDVAIVHDEATDETILEIEVRGKRGVGYCKSMPNAVRPFERMKERRTPEPADHLFPVDPNGNSIAFSTSWD